MQQIQDNEPNEADIKPFELKERLMARAGEPGAAGTIGRLLRDTPDLLEIMGDASVVKVVIDSIELYRWKALAGLTAQLRPRNSAWFEVGLEGPLTRIGCLCIGTGAGTLAFYGAGCGEGQEIIPKRGMLFRLETAWRPIIDWDALENGTWSPSNSWLRRAGSWMEEHLCGCAIEPHMEEWEEVDEMLGMFFVCMLMAVALSPLANPMPLAIAA